MPEPKPLIAVVFGWNHKEVRMLDIRPFVRSALLLAALALLASSACVPPIAFHDGLPAWTPEPGRADGSIGYHRAYWSRGEYSSSGWYLTPGVRFGFLQPPFGADVGLTSAVRIGDGFAALLGPLWGIGYQTRHLSLVVRPSAYVVSISEGGVQFGFDDLLWQVSLLAGNGAQSGKTHVSGGGRISRYGIGPVLLVDHSYGRVSLRLEGSYLLPRTEEAEGRLLTVGCTIGGPAPQDQDEPSQEN